jgi:hypothetical protein
MAYDLDRLVKEAQLEVAATIELSVNAAQKEIRAAFQLARADANARMDDIEIDLLGDTIQNRDRISP